MHIWIAPGATATRPRRSSVAVVGIAALFLAAACSSGPDASAGGDTVAVTLITKDSNNAFFVAMQNGAKKAAANEGVDLTVASGRDNGDEQGQITAIENAIIQQQDGILITPSGPGVNPAIDKARDAGLYVIALDTPPDPRDLVDITFATDNIKAGELIGQWVTKTLGGEPAVIAMIDAYNDKLVATDYQRHNGFLKGLGVNIDASTDGFADAPASGNYDGGTYTIVCQEPGQATQDDSRTATENCLNKNPDINVIYAINEPAAFGALEAVKATGRDGIRIVTIDGGCTAIKAIRDGSAIVATSQQYPDKMALLGVEAIAEIARGGQRPSTSPGLDFHDTGVQLVTDLPVEGLDSTPSQQAADTCWGA
jgi:fructose transport system substrate-binding protein